MSKNIVFQGKYLTVVTEEKIICGKLILFESVSMPHSVHGIPLYDNGDILLVDEKKWTDDRRKLRIMAGVQEPEDPSSEAAVKREATEELGIIDGEWEHFYTAQLQGTIEDTREYFIVKNFSVQNISPHEGEEIYGTKRVSLKSLIPEILAGEWGSSPTPLVLLMVANKLNMIS